MRAAVRLQADNNSRYVRVCPISQTRHESSRYVYGPGVDEPLVWYEGSGTDARRWLHADERGSVVAISDATGANFAINRYDEYGVSESTNKGRFQFTGQAWIEEAKLYYYKARFYSPSLGRFMQTDPIGYRDSMNLYAYVHGDPVNGRDPSGLSMIYQDGIGIESVDVNGCQYCGFGDFYGLGGLPVDVSMGIQINASSSIDTVVVTAQDEKLGKCWNGDVGVSATAQAILGVGGGSSFGFSYGGDLLDSRFFLKFQANGMYGPGAFAGVGVSATGGPGAVSAGRSSTYGFHMEANRGGGVAWSAGYDYSGPGGVSAGGAHERIPFGRLGAGVGYSFGAGAFTQSTIGFPSLGDIWNTAAKLLKPLVNLPRHQSSTCAN